MQQANQAADPQQKANIDIFIDRFLVGGARNYIRKTTPDAPWLCVGIMEKTNPDLFYASELFARMNIVGGGAYSLGHGMIHGYLEGSERQYLERAISKLNALPTGEIIFYHDESLCGLEQARDMGLELRFKPVSSLEWLVRTVEDNAGRISSLDIDAAVQLPCSSRYGTDRNILLNRLFELIGIRRVDRKFDGENRLCCGARGFFGLFSGDIASDADTAESMLARNVNDALEAGASHMVTMCPFCYAAMAPDVLAAGLTPVPVEGLVSLALYGQCTPSGLIFR